MLFFLPSMNSVPLFRALRGKKELQCWANYAERNSQNMPYVPLFQGVAAATNMVRSHQLHGFFYHETPPMKFRYLLETYLFQNYSLLWKLRLRKMEADGAVTTSKFSKKLVLSSITSKPFDLGPVGPKNYHQRPQQPLVTADIFTLTHFWYWRAS